MPLQLTAATSRVQKSTLRRSTTSPFSTAKRKKPSSNTTTPNLKRTKSLPADQQEDDTFNLRLEDEGLLTTLASDLSLSDVVQQIRYIASRQWSPIPSTGATGMNSSRIAEVLNFRRNLPPVVSVTHVHALSRYPTSTEREIGMLVNKGVVRRIRLPAREVGGASPGEGLVIVEEWVGCVRGRRDIEEDAREKYVRLLRDGDADVEFTQDQIASLVHAGFLSGASYLKGQADAYLRPGETTLGNLNYVSKAGIQHHAGSAEAVATGSREHIAGGSGFSRRISNPSTQSLPKQQHVLTLPNIGPYLKLLHDSRTHLLHLLAKSNRYRELPLSLLKERWEGGIAGNDEASKAQRMRGEWVGVVPGKTKKWKSFWGVQFEWVLEECLGAGLVECFRTGAVGVGVRAV